MKQIDVAAAVIIQSGRVFCAQRPDRGETAKKWEFPGGKIEMGETPEKALERELFEELGINAVALDFIAEVRHQYSEFFLHMKLFTVAVLKGKIELREHLDARWLSAEELYSVDWAPADLPVLPKIEYLLNRTI